MGWSIQPLPRTFDKIGSHQLVAFESFGPDKLSEIKPCCLSSLLNRIVSFININSVSLKTRDKNLNACYARFLTGSVQ